MLEFNLTQRERQLLIHLCTLSGQSKADFDAEIADLATAGPGAELVRLRFAPKGPAMELTKLDLRVLKDEGFIHFHWNLPDSGTGRLTSHALAAVESNFHGRPDSARAASAANDARAAIADGKAIALRFEKITTELIDLARDLIDADESLVARQEARSIADELSKPAPDEAIITRKIKRFVTRLALTFSSTADLALNGEKIGQFGERLAAWLVALSLWTEWHAANHPPTTPAPSKSPPASSAR